MQKYPVRSSRDGRSALYEHYRRSSCSLPDLKRIVRCALFHALRAPAVIPLALPQRFSTIRSAISEQHGLTASDVYLVPPKSLPKSTSGKLQRGQARELLLNRRLRVIYQSAVQVGPGDEDGGTEQVDLQDEKLVTMVVRSAVAEVLRCAPDALTDQRFTELDSLSLAQLREKLSSALSIDVPLMAVYACIQTYQRTEAETPPLPETPS